MIRNKILIEKLPLSIIADTYNTNAKYIKIQEYRVRTKDDRYLNFIQHGFMCARCGLGGEYANLETNYTGNHLNVYGEKEGQPILFTKDHIYPKSKGGLNNIKNYQVLCEECNSKKSDNSPMRLSLALQNGYATKKSVEKAVRTHRPKALIGV